jgi:hypothetical protein
MMSAAAAWVAETVDPYEKSCRTHDYWLYSKWPWWICINVWGCERESLIVKLDEFENWLIVGCKGKKNNTNWTDCMPSCLPDCLPDYFCLSVYFLFLLKNIFLFVCLFVCLFVQFTLFTVERRLPQWYHVYGTCTTSIIICIYHM